MKDLKKTFQRNSRKEEVKKILEKADFCYTCHDGKDLIVSLSESFDDFKILCEIYLMNETKKFIILGNKISISFEKKISDEALITVFDSNNDPIILQEIQEDMRNVKSGFLRLMSKKEEIENSLI